MGVHISECRSTSLDVWTLPQYNRMLFMGNELAKGIWEATLPADYSRPTDATRETFIRAKYERKQWFVPPTDPAIVKFMMNDSQPVDLKARPRAVVKQVMQTTPSITVTAAPVPAPVHSPSASVDLTSDLFSTPATLKTSPQTDLFELFGSSAQKVSTTTASTTVSPRRPVGSTPSVRVPTHVACASHDRVDSFFVMPSSPPAGKKSAALSAESANDGKITFLASFDDTF